MIQLKKNKSYYLLLPLLRLPNIYSKIRFVGLYNYYDNSNSTLSLNKRIHILTYNLEENKLKELSLVKEFVKSEYLDEELVIHTFVIPKEYITDVTLISIGEYTKCSNEYKKHLMKSYESSGDLLKELKLMFYPTAKDFEIKKEKYMIEDHIQLEELGCEFRSLEETFHLSNLIILNSNNK